tara:strand:+ start:724 stop:882 length:159 start_codon:yes stop_codon:yes gene_type:complete
MEWLTVTNILLIMILLSLVGILYYLSEIKNLLEDKLPLNNYYLRKISGEDNE